MRLSSISSVWPMLLAFVALGPGQVHAAPRDIVARARAEYVRLRNVDPTGRDLIYRKEWEVLATGMRGILSSKIPESEKGRLRLLSGDTHLRLYRATRQRSYLTAASDSVMPLATGPRHDLDPDVASEASLLLGDVSISAGRFQEAATWYRKSVTAQGIPARTAQQRLVGVQNGTFNRFLPDTDIEVPRLVRTHQGSSAPRGSPVIVIDPGHGGIDKGAIGRNGEQENEITLDIARRVQRIIESHYGYRVALTRNSDIFVPLARRTAFANRKEAAAFISLHVNASAAHDADGLEVYYLDNTNDEASRKLAERENGIAHGESLDDLSFMLSDLIQSGKLEDSIILSRSVEGSIRARVVNGKTGARSLGVKKGPFFVLVGAHMPCSLVELFFIDNEVDARMLQEDRFRSALASGVAEGIRSFLQRAKKGER